MVGLLGNSTTDLWDLSGSLDYGNGFQQQAGSWTTAELSASRTVGTGALSAELNTTLDGLQYFTPFTYGSYSAQFTPQLSLDVGPFTATLAPQASVGLWTATGQSGGISVLGGSVSLQSEFGAVTADVTAETHSARNGSLDGTYSGLGADLMTSVSGFDVGAGLKSWRAPGGREWGYDLYASKMIGPAARIDLEIARSVTDPLLATPGSFGASIAINWRIAQKREHAAAPHKAADIRQPAGNGRRVHFSVSLPDAHSVAVSGSFTDWNPVSMQRNGNEYTLDIVVPVGTHQYGFLVDGTRWYLPPDATGVVADDFGRKNATLLVASQ